VTDTPICSIVFVPGLGGHHETTWKAKDQTVWPRDMLHEHKDLKNIRVLSFKYNTTIKGSTSTGGIHDHANDLIVRLFDDREDSETASLRPLVLVGHSRGVMFFATPHFGLSPENWKEFANRVLHRRAPHRDVLPTSNMTRELNFNSNTLYRISENFKPLQPDLSFVTFTENESMQGMKDLVCFQPPRY
jgi:hypothetical protein